MKAWLAAVAACLVACADTPSDPVSYDFSHRNIGGRVWRGAFEHNAEAIFFEASDTALTLVYDTSLCGLLAAWKGPVRGSALHSDKSYAPQGPLYQRQSAARLWSVRNGGGTLLPVVRWLGPTWDSTGYVAFRYALILPSGDTIKVTEEPSWDNHYGDNSLQRDYKITDLPPGDTVSLLLGATPGRWKEIWSQSADGEMRGTGLQRRLDMAYGGIANVKVLWEGSAAP